MLVESSEMNFLKLKMKPTEEKEKRTKQLKTINEYKFHPKPNYKCVYLFASQGTKSLCGEGGTVL